MSVGFAGAVFEEGRKRRKEKGRAVDESFGALRDQGFRGAVFCYCFGHLELFVLVVQLVHGGVVGLKY